MKPVSVLLARLLDPASWDWGSVPDYVVMVTAIVSALLVVQQLAGLGDDRRQAEATRTLQLDQFRSEAQTARANLLLRIDEQFEGAAIFRSRARWIELRARFKQQHAAMPSPTTTRDAYVRSEMTAKLNDLWDRMQSFVAVGGSLTDEIRDYNLVIRLPNWIETIGMIAREGLIPTGDLVQLYGGVIRMTMEPIQAHMTHRRRDVPASDAFANALWLYAEAIRS